MQNKIKRKSSFEKFEKVSAGANVGLNILFIVFSLLCVLPLILVIMVSLSSEKSIVKAGFSFFPIEFSVAAYKFLWKNRSMLLDATKVSLIVTVIGTIVGTLLTTSMGYVLSRKEHKLNNFLTWLVFIPMIFSGGYLSAYFINRSLFNLGDTYWALILPLLVSSFNVVICRTYFSTTLPDSLVESAKIDGASQFRIYFGIVIPISLPVFATIALFLVFGYWNDWWQAQLYIESNNMKPLQSLLMAMENNLQYMIKNAASMGMSQTEMQRSMPTQSFRMAIAVVVILPISCAYPFFQRYFISGLTIGAVKG